MAEATTVCRTNGGYCGARTWGWERDWEGGRHYWKGRGHSLAQSADRGKLHLEGNQKPGIFKARKQNKSGTYFRKTTQAIFQEVNCRVEEVRKWGQWGQLLRKQGLQEWDISRQGEEQTGRGFESKVTNLWAQPDRSWRKQRVTDCPRVQTWGNRATEGAKVKKKIVFKQVELKLPLATPMAM